jgi:hypothetical protein
MMVRDEHYASVLEPASYCSSSQDCATAEIRLLAVLRSYRLCVQINALTFLSNALLRTR